MSRYTQLLLVALALLLALMAPLHRLFAAGDDRIRVLPLLVVPKDGALPEAQAALAWQRLERALKHTQAHYKAMLRTDTFEIEANPTHVYRAAQLTHAYDAPWGTSPDGTHVMLKELLAHFRETRESTRRIYLLILVRPDKEACVFGSKDKPCWGSGRSIDGYPEPGGGIVQLEYTSLMEDRPYRFLSTLPHEFGHGLGLTHVDCFGREMYVDDSIMSYNQAHLYQPGQENEFHGTLNPEEFALLSLHKRLLPNFRYDPAVFDPAGKLDPRMMACSLGPMDATLGLPEHKGYRLYFNGQQVSGKEAAIYSFDAAEQNCKWNHENQKGVAVTCTYDGTSLEEWRKRIPTR